MLSLGSGHRTNKKPPRKIYQQLTKAAPPQNEFGPYNIEGGTLTFTAGQTKDGSSDWLKVQYPNANQTNISGVSRRNLLSDNEAGPGIKYRFTFDLFLETAADWTQGAGNPTVTTKVYFGGETHQVEVTPDQTVSIDTGVKKIMAKGQNDLLIYFDAPNDLPEAQSVFYIKNFTFTNTLC